MGIKESICIKGWAPCLNHWKLSIAFILVAVVEVIVMALSAV